MNDDLKSKQIEREKDCHKAGIDRFEKNETSNKTSNNGSATTFGLMIKKHLLHKVIKCLDHKIKQTVGHNKKHIAEASLEDDADDFTYLPMPEQLPLQRNPRARKLHDSKDFMFLLILSKLCSQLERHELQHE